MRASQVHPVIASAVGLSALRSRYNGGIAIPLLVGNPDFRPGFVRGRVGDDPSSVTPDNGPPQQGDPFFQQLGSQAQQASIAAAKQDALTRLAAANLAMQIAVANNDLPGEAQAQADQTKAVNDLAALGVQPPAVVPMPHAGGSQTGPSSPTAPQLLPAQPAAPSATPPMSTGAKFGIGAAVLAAALAAYNHKALGF